jgi:hypothetical protein
LGVTEEGMKMKIIDSLSRLLIDEETQRKLRAEGKEPMGFRGLLAVIHEHVRHLTVYNPLAILAGAAFLASARKPWWHASVSGGAFLGGGRTLDGYPFYLKHTVPPEGWRFLIETPILLSAVLICGLLLYFLIVVWGGTSAGNKGRLFVAAGGLLMLIYTAGFFSTVYLACYRIGGTPLEDFTLVATLPVTVHPQFMCPYYYAIGAGIVCLLSSLIHGWSTIRLSKRKKSDSVVMAQ